MSTHKIRFYGELLKIILQLSSNTLLSVPLCIITKPDGLTIFVMILCFLTDRSGKTVKERSDQGLRGLSFCLNLLDPLRRHEKTCQGDSNECPQHMFFNGELSKITLQLSPNTCVPSSVTLHTLAAVGIAGYKGII